MLKKCENCSKEFEPRQPHFRLCPDCFSSSKQKPGDLPKECLLKSYYDREGNLLKEIFIGIPKTIAEAFSNGNLANKQLYDFKKRVLKARTIARLRGIEKARPILYKCIPEVEYQFKRKVVPQSFKDFIKHNIPIAIEDKKQLEGFYEFFENIYMYF